jgi:3-dehydroquinate synthetase
LGLFYELEIFYLLGRMDEDTYLEIVDLWERFFDFEKLRNKLSRGHSMKLVKSLLSKDKKSQGQYVKAPVVYGVGKVEVEKIPADVFLRFLNLQGIAR